MTKTCKGFKWWIKDLLQIEDEFKSLLSSSDTELLYRVEVRLQVRV